MKTPYYFLLNSILILLLLGCDKYLNVHPEGHIREETAYKDEKSIQARLNSIYQGLAEEHLYGQYMTITAIEVMGQRYSLNRENMFYPLSRYDYESTAAKQILESIWTAAYSNIYNLNEFMAGLEKHYQKAGLSLAKKELYQGEALAARAFIHFDMLRLFGPVYDQDSLQNAIPYAHSAEANIKMVLPANQILRAILQDLRLAEQLLGQDPIIQGAGLAAILEGTDNFLQRRNYRLNYFAVKALQGRVQLYRGEYPAALQAVMRVIASEETFPWTTAHNVWDEKENPDRIFSTEMILGIESSKLYANFTSYFSSQLNERHILATNPTRLYNDYEHSKSDYRFFPQWVLPADGSKNYRTSIKYQDVANKELPFRFTIPLLKMSEIYLIAAEASPNPAIALSYLNTLRMHRGLDPLSSTEQLDLAIQKEYYREFYAEGQLFFYQKRKNLRAIPDGNMNTGNIAMDTKTYVPKLPVAETLPRP